MTKKSPIIFCQNFGVSKLMVDENAMKWDEIDFLKHYIKTQKIPNNQIWYAKKLEDNVFLFKIFLSHLPSFKNYSKEGWKIHKLNLI